MKVTVRYVKRLNKFAVVAQQSINGHTRGRVILHADTVHLRKVVSCRNGIARGTWVPPQYMLPHITLRVRHV